MNAFLLSSSTLTDVVAASPEHEYNCIIVSDNGQNDASNPTNEGDDRNSLLQELIEQFSQLDPPHNHPPNQFHAIEIQGLTTELQKTHPKLEIRTAPSPFEWPTKLICKIKTKRQAQGQNAIIPIPITDDSKPGYSEVNVLSMHWGPYDNQLLANDTDDTMYYDLVNDGNALCYRCRRDYTRGYLQDLLLYNRDSDQVALQEEKGYLKTIFEGDYFFNYDEFEIDSTLDAQQDAYDAVQTRVTDFIREHGSKRDSLTILAYSGHGLADKDQFYWSGSRHRFHIEWSSIQEKVLKQAKSDVLLLLDCCFTGGTNTSMERMKTRLGHREKIQPLTKQELLGAVSSSSETSATPPDTFTWRFVDALSNEQAKPGSVTVDFLHTKISQDKDRLNSFRSDLGLQRKGESTITLDPCYA